MSDSASPLPTEHLNVNGLSTLVSLNMPQPVLDYVRTRPGLPTWVFFAALALCLTLFFVAVLGVCVPLTRAPVPRWMMQLGLLPRDTLLVDVQLLSPILGIVMLAFLVSQALLSAATLLHRRFAIGAALLGIQRAANRQNELWFLGQCLRRIDRSLPPEDYLLAYHWAAIRVALRIGVWILIPTLLVAGWELLSCSYATPQGIKAAGMFTWRRPFVTWDEVQKLTTGATGNDRSKPIARYVVHFADGSRDLARWQLMRGDLVSSNENLLMLFRIDNELRARHVPWDVAVYDFGIHRGKPQWDAAAFRKLRAQLNPLQRSVFDRVYRYPHPQ
jgi:hypothetical protein